MVHDQKGFISGVSHGRTAAWLRVVKTGHDGSATLKSNCDPFTVERGRSARVHVRMAGETTPDRAERT